MNLSRHSRYLLAFISSCLLFLLAACGQGGTVGAGGTPTVSPTTTHTSTPAVTPTTAPVPPTQTSCPSAGTARALVTAPLVLGNHPNIVYIAIGSGSSTLNRYDVIAKKSTVIVTVSGNSLSSAQVSADGQWILFTNGPRLQAVRMDGQGLQTLYCDSLSGNFQWSTDQKLIAFETASSTQHEIKLIRVADGTVETVFAQSLYAGSATLLRTWLDPTHLYLSQTDADVPADDVVLLDLSKGLNQTVSDLVTVVPRQPGHFQDFDSSYDATQLFIAHSPCQYSCNGPGDITVLPAKGGTGRIIYSNQAYSVVEVRAITPNTLLFRIGNRGFPDQNSGDHTHNGIWAIHPDGTGLTRLTTDTAPLSSVLNMYSQYPWSNASRDGTMYAVEQQSQQKPGGPPDHTILLFGELGGGAPTPFVETLNSSIVGWTTMA